MKKFLSLLLALVMTMSLVTISAGATEYKDLTDKDELGPQYQEAVAVLNKIGVITGYDDGSFRPDVKLTRGAAAKIIVSLLIGPEAANNLPNNYAPYPDVPANHTFAGVISYCKTKGIISGYGDGTFKPANDLTGYAFAKMLLGALGYDATIEKFVDTGWTMNVLNVGQEASLFDRLDFHGSEAVTRKDAALLALNTLKATVVEYKEGLNINVTGENTNVTVKGDQAREYKLSNQDYARNILPQRRDISNITTSRADYNTVEFAEEHFVDLRLPHDKYDPTPDEFGRPSAEWSYKKLSIGKFPLVPDFEYTTQVIRCVETTTDAAKIRALGLTGYGVAKTYIGNTANNSVDGSISTGTITARTRLWMNGVGDETGANAVFFDGRTITVGGRNVVLDSVADIAEFTDNGTLVQVYVDNNGADFITDVVVVKTQLMEVRRIGSDFVALDIYDDKSDDRGYGFNDDAINVTVNNVDSIDDTYEFLSGLKAGDIVAVVPVAVDHDDKDFDVAEAYTPETATGALTDVETYGNIGTDDNAVNVTVGGTKYNIAQWNKDLVDVDANSIKVTIKDVTLYLDKYGNTMLAKDIGSTEDWMIIGNYRQGLVNGIVVTYANGWDIKGNAISLNVGYQHDTSTGVSGTQWYEQRFPVGSLVHYSNDTTSNTAEWQLWGKDARTGEYITSQGNGHDHGVFDVYVDKDSKGSDYSIYANSQRINLIGYGAYNNDVDLAYADSGVKFIYVTMDADGEIDSIEFKDGIQRTTNDELLAPKSSFHDNIKQAQACVTLKSKQNTPNEDSAIKAVVIKSENNAVSVKNLLYISNYVGSAHKDAKGTMVQGYEVAMMGEGNKLVATGKTIYSYKTGLKIGSFARYTPATHDEYEDFYDLRPFYADNAIGSAEKSVAILKGELAHDGAAFVDANKNLVHLDPDSYTNTTVRAAGHYNIESYQDKDHNIYNVDSDAAKNLVCLAGAQWLDLTSKDWNIESSGELKDAYGKKDIKKYELADGKHRDITLTLLFNDNPENDDFRQVYLVVVNSVSMTSSGNGHTNTSGGSTGPVDTTGLVRPADTKNIKTVEAIEAVYAEGNTLTGVKVYAPEWIDINKNGDDINGADALSTVGFVRKNAEGKPYSDQTLIPTGAATKTWKTDHYEVTFAAPVTLSDLTAGDYYDVTATWTRAKIQITGDAKDLVKLSKASLAIGTEDSTTISVNSTSAYKAIWTIVSGVDLNGAVESSVTADDIKNPGVAVGKNNAMPPVDAVKALGTGYVVINVAPNAGQTPDPTYSITGTSDTTAITGDDASIEISVLATSNVAAGTPVTFTAALDRAPTANRVESYDVTVKLIDAAGKTIETLEFLGVTDSVNPTKNWKISDNINIADIEVTYTPNLAAAYIEEDSAVADRNTIVLSYVGDISSLAPSHIVVVKAAGGSANATAIDKNYAPGKMEITFAADLANGDVVTLLASKIEVAVAAYADAPTLTGNVYTFVISTTGTGASTKWSVEGKGIMDYEEAADLAAPEEGGGSAEKTVTVSSEASGWTATSPATVGSDGSASIVLTSKTATEGDKYTVTYKIDEGNTTTSGQLTVSAEKTLTLSVSGLASATSVTVTAVNAVPTYTIATPTLNGVSDWEVTTQSIDAKAAGDTVTFTLTAAAVGVIAKDAEYTVTMSGLEFTSAKITTAGTDSVKAVMTVTCKVPDATNANIDSVEITGVTAA